MTSEPGVFSACPPGGVGVIAPRAPRSSSAGTADSAKPWIVRPPPSARRTSRHDRIARPGRRPRSCHPRCGISRPIWIGLTSVRPSRRDPARGVGALRPIPRILDSETVRRHQTGGFSCRLHSPKRPARWSIRQVLPWAGMGLCLILLAAHMSPTTCSAHEASCGVAGSAVRAGVPVGPGAETDGPGHSVDHLAVRVEVPGGQDRDRAGAVGPDRHRGRRRRADPGQRRPAGRGPSPRLGDRARGPCRARAEGQAGRSLVILDSPEIGTARLNLRAEAARAGHRAIRGRAGNRRSPRTSAADPRAAQGDQDRSRRSSPTSITTKRPRTTRNTARDDAADDREAIRRQAARGLPRHALASLRRI